MKRKQPWPLDYCKARVAATWGGEARHLLGAVIYEALLNEQLLLLLFGQDESVSSDRIAEVLRDGRRQIVEELL